MHYYLLMYLYDYLKENKSQFELWVIVFMETHAGTGCSNKIPSTS